MLKEYVVWWQGWGGVGVGCLQQGLLCSSDMCLSVWGMSLLPSKT